MPDLDNTDEVDYTDWDRTELEEEKQFIIEEIQDIKRQIKVAEGREASGEAPINKEWIWRARVALQHRKKEVTRIFHEVKMRNLEDPDRLPRIDYQYHFSLRFVRFAEEGLPEAVFRALIDKTKEDMKANPPVKIGKDDVQQLQNIKP